MLSFHSFGIRKFQGQNRSLQRAHTGCFRPAPALPRRTMSDAESVKNSEDGKKTAGGWHPVVLAVFALGIVSIALLVWMHQINIREDADILLSDAIMDLEVNVASFHFRFEENYYNRVNRKIEEVIKDLDRAIGQAEAIRNGGLSKFGPSLPVIRDPRFPEKVQKIIDLLVGMKLIALELSSVPIESKRSQSIEERFDKTCDEILEGAETLEFEIERSAAAHREDSRHLVYWIFFAWSGVVTGSTISLWNRERLRRKAEASILSLNTHLESQTKELTRHREHMMELVEDRTARLKLTNEELTAEVAERQEVEKELRKSEERYRTLIETMEEGLTVLDIDGALVYVNEKFCEMLNRSHTEILGNPLSEFIAFDRDVETARERLDNIAADDSSRFEIAFSTKDGRAVYTIVSLKGIQEVDGHVSGCFAVITDITEKVALQADSLRTAHLASLGEMAASVAHEINNPINGIINYARLICEDGNVPEQEKEIAGRIQTEGRRIAGIVKNLLLFGRPGPKEKVPVNVNEVLQKALDLTGTGLRNDGIEIRTALMPDLPRPVIDPQELQRVFINLISNAQHALNQKYQGWHENKVLEIFSERVPINASSHVRISFRDRGIGIPSDIVDKVKQPFFSTRPKGKGTGLGLSISEGIVGECGGSLAIESVEGEFTSIRIDLPASVGAMVESKV